jgi:flagellar motor switch protein FliN/FliY
MSTPSDNVPGSSAGPTARPIRLQELPAGSEGGSALFAGQFELIKGVVVRLAASVGRAELSVADLFALKEGSVLALDKATDEPVEVYLDDRLVARGELVVVGDHFGVRVTELGTSGA